MLEKARCGGKPLESTACGGGGIGAALAEPVGIDV
jgi:hypothetical protein